MKKSQADSAFFIAAIAAFSPRLRQELFFIRASVRFSPLPFIITTAGTAVMSLVRRTNFADDARRQFRCPNGQFRVRAYARTFRIEKRNSRLRLERNPAVAGRNWLYRASEIAAVGSSERAGECPPDFSFFILHYHVCLPLANSLRYGTVYGRILALYEFR